jgi:hypothetical protein
MNAAVSASPEPARRPFSAITALSDAFTYILQGFVPLWRLSWRFLAFVCAVSAALFLALWRIASEDNEIAVHVIVGVGILLAFLVSTAYYIIVVRHWLLGEANPPVLRVYLPFLFRIFVLTLLLVAVVAIVFAPAFLAGLAGIDFLSGESEPSGALVIAGIIGLIFVTLLALLLAMYLAGRLTPWLVAAAVERPLGIAQAWGATRGAGIRIAAGAVCLAIAFGIVDITIDTSVSPILGVTSDAFELLYRGELLLPLFVLLLLKLAVYFLQFAASMVYCGSVYRQTSGG